MWAKIKKAAANYRCTQIRQSSFTLLLNYSQRKCLVEGNGGGDVRVGTHHELLLKTSLQDMNF